ncbi:ribokinase [Halomonas eurihalina]|uniref:Ribokinase n=1 Tax=Halomonas eurihalina TaxID=42566 RepID=A0A5D9DAM6_HALER|nr:ribokinase [Halomonas eurihalina]MDR5858663.1 ribokinase [Halomonas eurihalina]TZG40846.1 ribokinase [Halomonas eurihalina]
MLHNFGSINLDHFYRVPHLVRPGETLAGHDYRVGLGGKGANQSLAMARAGGRIRHWGRLGRNDAWAKELLAQAGVDTKTIALVDEPGGHAIIQVDDQGENAILLFPGANHGFSEATLDELIEAADPGDWLLAQNECNALAMVLERAHARGLNIAFNPAPMTEDVASLPLELCQLLFVNRGEAEELTGCAEGTPSKELLDALADRLPATETVLTLGGEGAWYQHGETRRFQPPLPVTPRDTTAAGDTFIGYYLAARQAGMPTEACLERAATAAAIGVQRLGATESIPELADVEALLDQDT